MQDCSHAATMTALEPSTKDLSFESAQEWRACKVDHCHCHTSPKVSSITAPPMTRILEIVVLYPCNAFRNTFLFPIYLEDTWAMGNLNVYPWPF